MNDIATWFLILSLLFPRLTLFIAYCNGSIPANTIPLLGDVIMAVFIPRILILIYIAANMGASSGWFCIHLIVAIIAMIINGVVWNAKMKS